MDAINVHENSYSLKMSLKGQNLEFGRNFRFLFYCQEIHESNFSFKKYFFHELFKVYSQKYKQCSF